MGVRALVIGLVVVSGCAAGAFCGAHGGGDRAREDGVGDLKAMIAHRYIAASSVEGREAWGDAIGEINRARQRFQWMMIVGRDEEGLVGDLSTWSRYEVDVVKE